MRFGLQDLTREKGSKRQAECVDKGPGVFDKGAQRALRRKYEAEPERPWALKPAPHKKESASEARKLCFVSCAKATPLYHLSAKCAMPVSTAATWAEASSPSPAKVAMKLTVKLSFMQTGSLRISSANCILWPSESQLRSENNL